jgi:hypothetical protein
MVDCTTPRRSRRHIDVLLSGFTRPVARATAHPIAAMMLSAMIQRPRLELADAPLAPLQRAAQRAAS